MTMKNYRRTAEAVSRLSPEQHRIPRQSETERRGGGQYLHNKEPGAYVDVVPGESLFTSSDKHQSGCGWPSFTKPVEPANILELRDTSHGAIRTEARSSFGATHPGYVFPNGMADRNGPHYSINSASLRVVSRDRMEMDGYVAYLDQVEDML